MLGRLRRSRNRAIRVVNKLLGPDASQTPSPLPEPSSSCTLNLTILDRTPLGTGRSLDGLFLQLSKSLRLGIFLYPFIALWITGFILLIRQQWYDPASSPVISCIQAVWNDWPPDVCGVNATDCAEYLQGSSSFRCLGGCDLTTLGNPRWVGNQEINGVPLVIGPAGTSSVYRADSWICAAALHANLISASYGGGVSVSPLDSSVSNFTSTTSNHITSTAFLPSFPGAFKVSSVPTKSPATNLDLHYPILTYNAGCIFLLTLLFSPPPFILFSILLTLGYLQIILVSDIPNLVPDWSGIIGGFPAVAFTGYWIYHVSFKTTLRGFRDLPFECALWQGLGYWIGIESSTIFARLPISRLGYGGLSPAAIVEIVVIVIIVSVVILIQAFSFRRLGLLRYYLIRYLPLVPIIIILANLGHGYILRPHHYLLALLALPVLSLPNQISLFGQAFFLGLFLDGVGRWGWDSLVESTASLLGDAVSGTSLPAFTTQNSSTLSWTPLTADLIAQGITAYSLVVDDIQLTSNYTSSNVTISGLGLAATSDHYLRLAFMANGSSQDYTDPVTWSAAAQSWLSNDG